MPDIAGSFDLAPADALKYFRSKGLTKSFNYQDVEREEHATAFTVAKMMDLDLLSDTRAAIDRAIANGKTFEQFKADIEPTLQTKGWIGVQAVTDPVTGEDTVAALGTPRRLRTIFQTNLQTAYAAGNWAQVADNTDEAPFLLYDAVLDDHTRPEHREWNGTVLRYDDSWWDSHTPPCGYNCRCSIVQLSADEAARRGYSTDQKAPASQTRPVVNTRTGEVSDVPIGVDPGFDYNPGKLTRDVSAAQAMATKVAGADADLGAAAYYQLRSQLQPSIEKLFAAWVRGVEKSETSQGRWQIAGVMHPKDVAFLKDQGIAPVTAEIAIEDRLVVGPKQARHKAAGNELTSSEWQNLPRMISNPDAVLFDKQDGKLLYVYPAQGEKRSKIVVSPDLQTRRPKASLNAVRTGFKVPVKALSDLKRYEIVRGDLK